LRDRPDGVFGRDRSIRWRAIDFRRDALVRYAYHDWQGKERFAIAQGLQEARKRSKSSGTYVGESELCEVLTEAYQPALERATLEAFEGCYDEVELGQKVDRATSEQKALELIVAHQEGQDR
jgi:hypothetical protein